ncbi:hypothetical protein C8Q72DRAFT_951275, partial [Fomitopsis betulina]
MSLARLVAILSQHPTIACSLSVESFLLFFRLTQHLREKLSWSRAPDLTGPPPELPHDVMDLLSRALSIDHARYPGLLANCWAVTHDFVWSDSVDQDICEGGWRYPDLLSVFLNHGVHAGFGFRDMYPPSRFISTRTVLFTSEWGPIPAWSYSGKCPRCSTQYYPTYYVQEQKAIRTHYRGIPQFVHVGTHTYLERLLCQRFRNAMVCAWVSATNSARMYMLEHSNVSMRFPSTWPTTYVLSTDTVWDGFFLHALLEEYDERNQNLVLNHNSPQSERLAGVLRERNRCMMGTGQELYNHACDACCAHPLLDLEPPPSPVGARLSEPIYLPS